MDYLENLQRKVQNRKSEHHHWILHIRNSLGTNFQLKLKILNFGIELTQKGYFQSKKEKKGKIYIFELV